MYMWVFAFLYMYVSSYICKLMSKFRKFFMCGSIVLQPQGWSGSVVPYFLCFCDVSYYMGINGRKEIADLQNFFPL